jgi:tRNA(Ile2)-agmatinylcytidine synthase
MIIGIDDTDSKDGMCTTYLTAVLIEKLQAFGTLKGFPHLIRLNPNIKYKTRGNAALALEIDVNPDDEQIIIDITTSLVEEMADFECDNTNPGIVFLKEPEDQGFKKELEEFMWQAMRDVLRIDTVLAFINKYGLTHRGYKNKRGLIGALAACGSIVCGLPDHTYELMAYRLPENFGTPRDIDRESVFRADRETYPGTWDTVDISNDTIVFAPHSPDPVLFGIRGDDINAIHQAFEIIRSEPIGHTVLYKTNQGTDLHLKSSEINDFQEEVSYIVTGMVEDIPRKIEGGHMFFTIEGSERIECAAFEPTKGFRDLIGELMPGDRVKVCGGYKKGTLNIEKIDILEMANPETTLNPVCPACSKRMKSAGKGQGYRCKNCSTKSSEVIRHPIKRNITPGIYEVPPCARRHISKPLIRCADPRAHSSR